MKKTLFGSLAAAALLACGQAFASGLLGPGDTIIAIDTDDRVNHGSNYPGGEAPAFSIDDVFAGTKYLNFSGPGTGLIVTPSAGATIVKSLKLTTGNDATGRDPASYEIYGTNDAIVSADNSDGLGGESWTLLDAHYLNPAYALPDDRNVAGPVVPVDNSTAYTSYKVIFPHAKSISDPLIQFNEIELFPNTDGSGGDITAPGDPILGINWGFQSRYPGGENPGNLLDDNVDSKYLNFGEENSGFIVTPASGASVATSFYITTANDAPARDPSSYEIYGTNDAIASFVNGQGGDESWTLISSGSLSLPLDRKAGRVVPFANSDPYTSYRVVFPTVRDEADANSMQISGFNFNVPEPSSVVMGVLAAVGCLGFVRRKR